MDKLCFTTSCKEVGCYPKVNISREADDIILSISAETGLSKTYIASEMIKFAAKYTEIKR